MRSQHIIALAAIAAACASKAPGAEPDAMSAHDHRAHARAHETSAAEHQGQYDPDASARRAGTSMARRFEFDVKTYNPTATHAHAAALHHEVARQHAEAARQLESFEEAQCSKFPPETRAKCPLLSVVARVEDVPGGAKLLLAPGVPAGAVVAHMQCHHAFGATAGFEGMPSCPMYLKQVKFELSPDGASVVITSDDDATAREIRERARAHLSK